MTWRVILFLTCLVYTGPIRMLHILTPILESYITILFILEDNPAILYNWTIIAILTSWLESNESRSWLFPFIIDLINFLYFWDLILRILHVWYYFLHWICILQPWLIVPHYIGVI